ncbi:MAG: hypothetical protein DRN90_00605 [Thermoproteota archaeon]|nr:MAG: hypothetical protein DRG83_01245 [Deltaproteobacteria bacterium]RLG49885.1 MAG: hypothetical protein DRN90_00605 [Candidatus Korarchaeota archaeon]
MVRGFQLASEKIIVASAHSGILRKALELAFVHRWGQDEGQRKYDNIFQPEYKAVKRFYEEKVDLLEVPSAELWDAVLLYLLHATYYKSVEINDIGNQKWYLDWFCSSQDYEPITRQVAFVSASLLCAAEMCLPEFVRRYGDISEGLQGLLALAIAKLDDESEWEQSLEDIRNAYEKQTWGKRFLIGDTTGDEKEELIRTEVVKEAKNIQEWFEDKQRDFIKQLLDIMEGEKPTLANYLRRIDYRFKKEAKKRAQTVSLDEPVFNQNGEGVPRLEILTAELDKLQSQPPDRIILNPQQEKALRQLLGKTGYQIFLYLQKLVEVDPNVNPQDRGVKKQIAQDLKLAPSTVGRYLGTKGNPGIFKEKENEIRKILCGDN